MFCIARLGGAMHHSCMDATMHKIEVGGRLRLAIEALGKSQAEVARAMGVSPTKLNNWLRGDNYPSNLVIVALCDRYNITADWLLRGAVSGMASPLADALWGAASASRQALTAADSRERETSS